MNSPRQDRYERKRCACQLRPGFRPSDRSVGLARSERLLCFPGTVASGSDGACRQFSIYTMREVYTTAVRGSLYGANERDWNIREERGTKLTTVHPCLGCVIVLISRTLSSRDPFRKKAPGTGTTSTTPGRDWCGTGRQGWDELGMDGWVQSQAIVDGGYFRDREGGWDESREGGPRERTTRWKRGGGVMVRRGGYSVSLSEMARATSVQSMSSISGSVSCSVFHFCCRR